MTEAKEIIRFYRVKEKYGCFSNFSPHSFELNGKVWPTSEHYFQAQKFAGTEYEERIRQEPSPMIAARLGRNRKWPLRQDWEAVKDEIMMAAVRAKFTQNNEIAEVLRATGEAVLIEHTTHDRYWADGGDGTGLNRLGEILMKVRQEIS